MQLSIICPGIRVERWINLYNSIASSFFGSWEIIFISPYPLPEQLKYKKNIQWIQDWGSPIRCQQRGLIAAKGDWINWAADDGVFLPNALDIAWKKLAEVNFDINHVVMGKYYEGNNDGDMPMQNNDYYILANHDATRIKWIPNTYFMLNVGMVAREKLLEVGGWDAESFEVCPMAYNDLAIRLQRSGVKFVVQDEMMFKCSHMPGHEGDHAPIHDGQIDHDQPLFKAMYSTPRCSERIKIDLFNWKNAPAKWERRFGK